MKNRLYKQIALSLNARTNCIKSNNDVWFNKWSDKIEEYNAGLPSGSGFDSGSEINTGESRDEKIVINTSYHFMDENGYYDGWYDYKIVIKPSLIFDFTLTIHGINRNDLKDYIYEIFQLCLMAYVDTESID